ncbi:MAG: nucleoid-associated protein EbfC [Actinomycetota bacterium]|nr:nucleoid-associated protein EbfC [Actinomycetota bacterium]MDQ1625406.1 nucleoid-associated protein EbfC [Actinomycetota bacterium]MDQ1643765.1 nucleoid-associated protein EbfC [Actinomycetota bacterium]
MQEQLLAAQQQLADTHVQGTAGGGLVTATITGAGEIVSLTIDPAAVDPADTESLADLVVAAIRDANAAAAALQSRTMSPLADGLDGLGGGLGLPGM